MVADRAMPRVEVVQVSEGTRPVLFAVHAAGGVITYGRLARHLHPEQPFYLLKGEGIDSTKHQFKDIYHLAHCYAEEIVRIQPDGPFMICGRNAETVLEVGRRLMKRGKTVSLTIVFDNGPPKQRKDRVSKPRRILSRIRRKLLLGVVHFVERARIALRRSTGQSRSASDLSLWDRFRIRRFARKQSTDRPKYINQYLFRDYVRVPYHARIVYIQSIGQKSKKPDYLEKWREVADEVVYHTVPGEHSTIYDAPHIYVLAYIVQKECDTVANDETCNDGHRRNF